MGALLQLRLLVAAASLSCEAWALGLAGSGAAAHRLSSRAPANAGNIRVVGLIPEWGSFLGGGNVNPLQYSHLETPMGRGA